MDYLRKYSKHLLAVFGVLLMIVFILPTGTKNALRQGGDERVASAGNQEITALDLHRAKIEWDFLSKERLIPIGGAYRASLADYTLAARLMQTTGMYAQFELPRALQQAYQINRSIEPIQYLLLTREAQRMGVQVSDEQVQAFVGAMPQEVDLSARESAIANWLRVLAAFDQVANAAKVSPALATHMTADATEKASLKMIPFTADQFRTSVVTPDNKQLDAFFEKYRKVQPGTGEFGFGYYIPNRVKLQYVEIPIEQVRKTVSLQDVYEAFKRDPNQVPPAATQPSTQPAQAATTRPAGQEVAAATTRPTTAPAERSLAQQFADMAPSYRDEIRNNVASEWANALAKSMEQAIRSDYANYQASRQSNTKASASSVGEPYDTFAYLEKLRAQVQKQPAAHGVTPNAATLEQLMSEKQIAEQPGIGKAQLGEGVSAARYATAYAKAFVSPRVQRILEEEGLPALNLFQPSPIFRDADGNIFIFRITAAEAAHEPATRAEVAQQVMYDYITHEAYQKAKAEAAKVLEVAKTKGFDAAVAAAGDRKVVQTPEFSNMPNQRIAVPGLPEAAYPKLVEGGYELYAQRLTTGKQNPIGLVEMPRGATVAVAELKDAQPATEHEYFAESIWFQQQAIERARQTGMIQKWFDGPAIEARMDYKAERQDLQHKPESPAMPEPPNPLAGM